LFFVTVSKTLRTRATSHPCERGAGPVKNQAGLAPQISSLFAQNLWRCVMSVEREVVSSQGLGSLQGCLVEGDPEQRRRERTVRRRALVLSVLLQSAVLLVAVLIPLFAKPARISDGIILPPAPRYKRGGPKPAAERPRPFHPTRDICRFCQPHAIPPTIVTHDDAPPNNENIDGAIEDSRPSFTGQIPLIGPRIVVAAPPETHANKGPLHATHIDPAMLIHRVEPMYPTLAKQLGRAGKVELRAVIATDGTIQSLQVVDGDPLFYQSALDAVRQWRYRPTVLNGESVQIDTFITVIYNMQR
jgi:protein TonB